MCCIAYSSDGDKCSGMPWTVEAGRWHIMGVLPVDRRPAGDAVGRAQALLLVVSKIYRIDPAD